MHAVVSHNHVRRVMMFGRLPTIGRRTMRDAGRISVPLHFLDGAVAHKVGDGPDTGIERGYR